MIINDKLGLFSGMDTPGAAALWPQLAVLCVNDFTLLLLNQLGVSPFKNCQNKIPSAPLSSHVLGSQGGRRVLTYLDFFLKMKCWSQCSALSLLKIHGDIENLKQLLTNMVET